MDLLEVKACLMREIISDVVVIVCSFEAGDIIRG
jgi:hypothetical protein